MPVYAVKCERCGEYERTTTVLRRLDPCDRPTEKDVCGGEIEIVYRANGGRTYQDDIPGGMVIENLGPHPVRVYSHSERIALAKSRGLEPFVRHMGVPGTDKSMHTQKWSAIPTCDPRPIAQLPIEERYARRLEAAERLGIPVEVLELVSGDVTTMRAEHSVDDEDRTGGEFAARAIRNQEVRVPDIDEVRGVMETLEYPHG